MNPRDRRLRLRKSTVRDLTAKGATLAFGGAVKFATKGDTEYATCGEYSDPQEGCTATCLGTCPNSACEQFTCPCEVSANDTCNEFDSCVWCG